MIIREEGPWLAALEYTPDSVMARYNDGVAVTFTAHRHVFELTTLQTSPDGPSSRGYVTAGGHVEADGERTRKAWADPQVRGAVLDMAEKYGAGVDV